MVWTREQDMAHDFFRVGGFHSLAGGIDAAGKLVAWRDHFITFSHDGSAPSSGADWSETLFPAQNVPNFQLSLSLLPLKTPTGPWRAPRSCAVAWVIQSFLHELAVAAGRDHLEFLLEVMGEPRALAGGFHTGRAADVIELAAEKAGWGRKLPEGHGLGLAFHYSHAGHFAEVAEVSVDKDKKVRLHRMVVAGDIGPIVNMSGARNQCEGGVVDGFSTMWTRDHHGERPHRAVELPSVPDPPDARSPGGRGALHPERQPAHRSRRARIAAGGAGDLQCDLRGDRPSRSHAAPVPGRLLDLSRHEKGPGGFPPGPSYQQRRLTIQARLRRRASAAPIRPMPSSASVPGSGTERLLAP